jgi:hypothetical protein
VGQGLGDKAAAVIAEMAFEIRLLVLVHGFLQVARQQHERRRRIV